MAPALRDTTGRVARFAGVGAAATAIYAILAWGLTFLAGIPATAASVAAYAMAAVFSYFGHKRVTFRSGRPHAREVPRFVAATAIGLALAVAFPLIFTDRLHWPRLVAIVLTCIAVPAANYLILEFLVFGSRGGSLRNPNDRAAGSGP